MNNALSVMTNIDNIPIFENSNYQYNGKTVPRVTSILSLVHDNYITNWANSLGFRRKKYEDELEYYANIGTIVHELCDCIVRGEPIDLSIYPREISNSIYNCVNGCRNWWNNLNTNYDVEVIDLERPLVCEWYGGTCDIILKINGQYFIGDFKTSNHIGYKYWCQLSAYINILEQQGIHISGCFILQLSRNRPLYKEHILHFSNPDHYQVISNAFNMFSGAVYTYYNRLNLTNQLEQINYQTNYILEEK